jgi:hypothetical protein
MRLGAIVLFFLYERRREVGIYWYGLPFIALIASEVSRPCCRRSQCIVPQFRPLCRPSFSKRAPAAQIALRRRNPIAPHSKAARPWSIVVWSKVLYADI